MVGFSPASALGEIFPKDKNSNTLKTAKIIFRQLLGRYNIITLEQFVKSLCLIWDHVEIPGDKAIVVFHFSVVEFAAWAVIRTPVELTRLYCFDSRRT